MHSVNETKFNMLVTSALKCSFLNAHLINYYKRVIVLTESGI